jgi:hypothetical protein
MTTSDQLLITLRPRPFIHTGATVRYLIFHNSAFYTPTPPKPHAFIANCSLFSLFISSILYGERVIVFIIITLQCYVHGFTLALAVYMATTVPLAATVCTCWAVGGHSCSLRLWLPLDATAMGKDQSTACLPGAVALRRDRGYSPVAYGYC